MARILIADDDPDFTNQLALVLRGAGHEIHACANGKDAVASLHAFPADLIILDMRMSYTLDGLDTLHQLRNRRNGPPPEVIVVSSLDEHADEFRRKAAQLGIAAWLKKPVDPAQILRILASHQTSGEVPSSTSGSVNSKRDPLPTSDSRRKAPP
jgi:CheY-like chemotaxis protein